MIPRFVHQIWIGHQPPPVYYELFQDSFRRYLPGFGYRLWREEDITVENFPLTYRSIQKARQLHGQRTKSGKTYSKWAQVADLMRLEIIYHHGGYYFDITFELLKNLSRVLTRTKASFVGCNEVRKKQVDYLSNSFFGAIPGHPILKRLLRLQTLAAIDFRSFDVAEETGPYFLKSGIRPGDDVHLFPTHYFYPYISWDTPDRRKSQDRCLSKRPRKGWVPLSHQGSTIYLHFPCTKYPNSYANKHWELGGTWL